MLIVYSNREIFSDEQNKKTKFYAIMFSAKNYGTQLDAELCLYVL